MSNNNEVLQDLTFVETKEPTYKYKRGAYSGVTWEGGLVDDFNEMPRAVKPALHKLPQEYPGDFNDAPRPGENAYGVITEHDLD